MNLKKFSVIHLILNIFIIMKPFNNYSKFVPYLYFITVVAYFFTHFNRSNGISAYPILVLGIPFLYQILKPNKKINFTLGIVFVCLSSYLILAYLFDIVDLRSFTNSAKNMIINGGLFVVTNFIMALWIIRNSMTKSF